MASVTPQWLSMKRTKQYLATRCQFNPQLILWQSLMGLVSAVEQCWAQTIKNSKFLVLVAYSHSVFFPQMHACISKEMDVRSRGERGIVFWCFCFAGGCASTMVSRPRNAMTEGKKGMQEKKGQGERGRLQEKCQALPDGANATNDEAATTVRFRQTSGGTGRVGGPARRDQALCGPWRT